MSIPTKWLEARAKTTPNKIALIYQEKYFSYQELLNLCRKYLEYLLNNFEPINRIALLLPNSIELLTLIHSIAMSKIELVLINTRLTQKEIQYQLDLMEVDLLISSLEFEEKIKNLKCEKLLIDHEVGLVDLSNGSISTSNEVEMHVPESQDVLCYVFTSGTTGKPKAVPLTYSNFFYSAQSSAYHLGISANDVWLLNMPMYHLGGLAIVFRSVLYGITILCHQGFSPKKISDDIVNHTITIMSLVPEMLSRIINLIPNESSLKYILVGGSKTEDNLIRLCIEKNIPIALTYGMTETCSQFATASPELVRKKPGTVGKPLLFSELKIFNKDQNGIGEIGVKGLSITSGYYKTSQEVFRDNYFLTGDLGYTDNEGDLFILQRRTDLIISGGENIYPYEIEALLLDHSSISDACVVGVDSEQWGQRPIAFITTNTDLAEIEVKAFMTNALASYKIPDHIYIISEIPRTSSGKILRKNLLKLNKQELKKLY